LSARTSTLRRRVADEPPRQARQTGVCNPFQRTFFPPFRPSPQQGVRSRGSGGAIPQCADHNVPEVREEEEPNPSKPAVAKRYTKKGAKAGQAFSAFVRRSAPYAAAAYAAQQRERQGKRGSALQLRNAWRCRCSRGTRRNANAQSDIQTAPTKPPPPARAVRILKPHTRAQR